MKEKDYSDYIAAVSNLSNVRSILAGFTFTVITLLLIQLPDPSQVSAQVVLFALAVLVEVFMYTIYEEVMETFRSMSKVPPWRTIFSSPSLTSNPTLHDSLTFFSIALWGITLSLMFLLWNLVVLASTTGIMWVVLMMLAYFRSYKPAVEHGKRARSH